MIKFSLLLIITLSSQSTLAQNITILVLGDSISAAYGLAKNDGWVHLLSKRLEDDKQHNYAVINASISGDTTSGGLQRLPNALEQHDPDLVIIELGGNDGLRGLSLKNMRTNLEAMVALCKSRDVQVLILGMRIPSNYGPVYAERFNKVYAKAAQNTGSGLMPFFLEPVFKDRSNFQLDGIHPAARAQAPLLDGMWPYLLEILP